MNLSICQGHQYLCSFFITYSAHPMIHLHYLINLNAYLIQFIRRPKYYWICVWQLHKIIIHNILKLKPSLVKHNTLLLLYIL